jgi:hypothetical protein
MTLQETEGHMFRILIGLLGLLIFLSGLVLGLALLTGRFQALALDAEETIYASIDPDAPLPCFWEVEPPERVMAEDKSQAVLVRTSNLGDKECASLLSLRAPGFDLSPLKEEQEATLPAQAKGSLSWILTPRKTGTYTIAVSDLLNTKIFGITVTNVFGLSTNQAQVLSVFGSLFGPMLTLPWWLDKFRQRKAKPQVSQGAA